MASDTITIAFNGDVSLQVFASQVQHFRTLILALSAEAGGHIEWIVDDLQPGSAIATIRGHSPDMAKVEQVVRAYGVVGKALETRQVIPFPTRVEKPARELVKVLEVPVRRIRSIRFETPEEDATVVPPGVPSVALHARVSAAYGAVGGRVQTLSSRGGLRFVLYDGLNDKPVSCYLIEGQEAMMLGAWGRRAIVEGKVSRDPITGRAVSIRHVTKVEVLSDTAPGSYTRARAILPLSPDDPKPEDVIRKLRDA